MEEFLSSIKESHSKVDLLNQSSISQEHLSQMILNIESNIKSELAPILELVLHLLTNATQAVQVSQGGEKGIWGVGSLKDSDKEKGVVIRKVSPTQILTSLPWYLTKTSTTTSALTKGISINEGARGSSLIPNKSTLNVDPYDKGKSITVEQSV